MEYKSSMASNDDEKKMCPAVPRVFLVMQRSARTMHYIQMGVSRPVIDLHLAKRNAIMYKK